MSDERGYRWGAWFFALVAVCSLAMLPFALSCCSRFSADELAADAALGDNGWEAGITPLAVALLDWPMGFRLHLMTLVAAILCLAATVALLLLARAIRTDRLSDRRARVAMLVSHAVLGSMMVGVLYILAAYAVGYVGYLGPANLAWMVGIPMVVALMVRPHMSGLLWAMPLALGGWLCMGILSITVGIPLD